MAVLVFAGFTSTGDAAAASSGVRCGSRITRDTTLTKDLHCKKDGLKIGASGITLDLGGHDIVGPGKPGTKGIQNSGHDGVVITGYAGGEVRGFDRGVELRKGADDNEVVGMHIRGGHYGVVLFDSDHARLDDNLVTAGAKADGYNGGSGAAIALYRSHENFFEENFSENNGVNVMVLENSHRNQIFETNFRDEIWADPVGHLHDFDPNLGTGLLRRNSDQNRIVGNIFAENANDGLFVDSKSTDNVVGGNLAINNNKLGMNIRGRTKDAGGNRALGNGWMAQCRGIACLNE
jgi:parallel beta-helix repeat protein